MFCSCIGRWWCPQLDIPVVSLPPRHGLHAGEARRAHGDAQQDVELRQRLRQEGQFPVVQEQTLCHTQGTDLPFVQDFDNILRSCLFEHNLEITMA